MAKDDIFVMVYRILSYLYDCMRRSVPLDPGYLRLGTKDFPIQEDYWNRILLELPERKYIRNLVVIHVDNAAPIVRIDASTTITLDGAEYLQENSKMAKVRDFLKGSASLIGAIRP